MNKKLPEDSHKVLLFIDEFTNFNDTEIGIKTIRLLSKLNYRVEIAPVSISGRTFISKGLLRTARKIHWKTLNYLLVKWKQMFH